MLDWYLVSIGTRDSSCTCQPCSDSSAMSSQGLDALLKDLGGVEGSIMSRPKSMGRMKGRMGDGNERHDEDISTEASEVREDQTQRREPSIIMQGTHDVEQLLEVGEENYRCVDVLSMGWSVGIGSRSNFSLMCNFYASIDTDRKIIVYVCMLFPSVGSNWYWECV